MTPWRTFCLLAVFLSAVVRLTAQADFLALQRRICELYEEYADAVVRVKAAYKQEEENKPQVIIGTGFFISREGHVLTNASIALQPDRLWVEHRHIAYSAKVIGEDMAANLALLKLESLPENFRFLALDDTPGLPPPGTFLLRISSPLDFSPSPAFGLVSGKESRFGQRYFPCDYLRTTIPAGPGDGGAALLDMNGKLIGMQVGSLPDLGSSYVLPARAALRIRDDLLFAGKVTYGWIGFEVREERSIADGRQIILSLIMPGTPAESSGMLAGDILVQIGDFPVRTVDDLRNAMFYTRVGQYTRVKLKRDNGIQELNVRLAARPETEPLLRESTPDPQTINPANSETPPPGAASTHLNSIIDEGPVTDPQSDQPLPRTPSVPAPPPLQNTNSG